jgi:hypothetical protein
MKKKKNVSMHFPTHFFLDLFLVVAATAAPTGTDSDSSETTPSPPTLRGKTRQTLAIKKAAKQGLQGTAAETFLHFAKAVAEKSVASGPEEDEDCFTVEAPVLRGGSRGKTPMIFMLCISCCVD